MKPNAPFFQVGVGCEQLKWEKMMTLATHQIAIEADLQISDTGPIRESMGAWIERLCFRVVEPTKSGYLCTPRYGCNSIYTHAAFVALL